MIRCSGTLLLALLLFAPNLARADKLDVVADAGQAQLLRKPVLQRAEDALASSPRLRRIGGDVLDAELGKRAAGQFYATKLFSPATRRLVRVLRWFG